MTVAAVNMEAGKYYRLTRDCWTGVYYMRCPEATRRQLEKRLAAKNPQTMTPDDYRTWTVLLQCRDGAQVLGIRFLRYRDESGSNHETRAYVAFPPDYQLRRVARPPGYGSSRKRREGARADAEEATDDDSAEAAGQGCEGAGRRDSAHHRMHLRSTRLPARRKQGRATQEDGTSGHTDAGLPGQAR